MPPQKETLKFCMEITLEKCFIHIEIYKASASTSAFCKATQLTGCFCGWTALPLRVIGCVSCRRWELSISYICKYVCIYVYTCHLFVPVPRAVSRVWNLFCVSHKTRVNRVKVKFGTSNATHCFHFRWPASAWLTGCYLLVSCG